MTGGWCSPLPRRLQWYLLPYLVPGGWWRTKLHESGVTIGDTGNGWTLRLRAFGWYFGLDYDVRNPWSVA